MTINWYNDKITLGMLTFASAGASALGGIVSAEDERWLYVTLSVSMLTAVALSLIFRKPEETIGIVIGRMIIAIIFGVAGTRVLVQMSDTLSAAHTDILVLAMITTLVVMAAFLIGYQLLRLLETESGKIAKKLFSAVLKKLG